MPTHAQKGHYCMGKRGQHHFIIKYLIQIMLCKYICRCQQQPKLINNTVHSIKTDLESGQFWDEQAIELKCCITAKKKRKLSVGRGQTIKD
jgi:hypothetical protein